MNKTAKTVVTTDAQIDAAIAKAKIYNQQRPHAIAVRYRRADDLIALTLSTGVEIAIPRELLQGLETATPTQIADVEIDDFGSSLHWKSLDVHHYVPGLVDGVFGTRKWMSEIGRKGGAARSEAKTKAVRENGLKGGRPRKDTGLDARYRDSNGVIRVRNGQTRVSTLRNLYGETFASGIRSDMKLDTLLDRAGVSSLSEFQKKQRRLR